MCGIAALRIMCDLRSARTLLICSIGFTSPNFARTPASIASFEANTTPRCCGAVPSAPHIFRCTIGSDNGMLPLPSPIADHTTKPLLMTIHGLMPKDARGQSTRSASFPGAMDPT